MGDSFMLPPGQKPSARLYPISVFGKPERIDPSKYTLRIKEEGVEKVFTIDELSYFPRVERQFDIHCVDGWSYLGPVFEGIQVAELFKGVKVRDEIGFVLVKCLDGYSTNLPLTFLLSDSVILASRMDGEDLKLEHGFPLRLVVDGKYAYKDAKWVTEFELLKEDRRGFWEERGYSVSGDVYREERRDW